jgi:hypothetical protein
MKLFISLLIAGAAWAAPATVLEPLKLHQDFQENTLGQWASYPPPQDIGYEPSISPTSEFGAPGGRSMMRVFRPVSTGRFRLGFIRKLDAVASGATHVAFEYRLKPAHAGDAVEIGLAGGDGKRYRQRVAVGGDGWLRADVRFPEAPRGVRLEAIYIQAIVRQADIDTDYRFLIDNVTLDASRAARFAFEEPRATAIFPWEALVAGRVYAAGETIQIRAKSPVPLAKSECELKDQDGRVVARGTPDSCTHLVAASDPTGVWRAELHGATSDGAEVRTTLRMIVRRPTAGHPRLYFGPGDKAKMAARTTDPRTAPIWERLAKTAASTRSSGRLDHGGEVFTRLDSKYLLPTLLGYFDVLNRAMNRIGHNALAAWITDDAAARDAARAALADVSRWSAWAPPWFKAHGQHTYYPAGQLTGEVALGYDLLYGDLSAEERQAARAALAERGIHETFREYVADNRLMANTSNWIGHTIGGAILAASAIQDDGDTPELATWLGGVLMKFEDHLAASYLDDGSYGEGISYQEFDLVSTTAALNALDRVYGIDYWSRSHVLQSLTFPLHTFADTLHDSFDMGDSHPPSGYTSAGIVARANDPVLRWYFDHFQHRSMWDFLFFPEPGPSERPSGSGSRYFPRKGNVVFRTGWGPDETILQFRAGPNHNHNHADQGSFLLRALGENIAVEAGPAHYYNDPYYADYFSQAAGHNTILVDGDPGSQEVGDTAQYQAFNAHPHIVDAITSDFHDAFGAEIASVYKDRLARFTRRIVFMKPRYFVISDDVAASAAPVRLDWQWHVKDRSRFTLSAGRALYRGSQAAVDARILEPASADVSVREGHIQYSVFSPNTPAAVPPQPGILTIATPKVAGARFLLVLAPGKTEEDAGATASALKRSEGTGCSGVAGGGDIVMFRAASARQCSYQDWTTDAAVWTYSAEVISGELVTKLARGAGNVFSSDRPVSFAAHAAGGETALVVISDAPAKIRFRGSELSVPAGRFETKLAGGR